MEIESATFFERAFDFHDACARCRDPAALDWLEKCGPDIRAEEGSGYVRIVQVQNGGREALEFVGPFVGEVYNSPVCQVKNAAGVRKAERLLLLARVL